MGKQRDILKAGDTITSGTGSFKAVCHKCHYEGFEPNNSRCGMCGFPMILEPYSSARIELREIFDRSSVELGVGVKAPPLPGVDPQKRKAQLLAEARRRLRTQSPSPRPSAAAPERPRTAPPATGRAASASANAAADASGQSAARTPARPGARPEARPVAPVRHRTPGPYAGHGGPAVVGHHAAAIHPRRLRLRMTLAFVSAVLAGVVAAAMNSGL